jgi:hypothetical protein
MKYVLNSTKSIFEGLCLREGMWHGIFVDSRRLL